MRVISYLVLALSILIPMKSYSQEIPLSLDDLIPGGKSFAKLHEYRSERPRQLRWYGEKLTYVKGDSILVLPATGKAGKQEVLTSVKDINRKLGTDVVKKLTSVTALYGEINSIFLNVAGGDAYLLNLSSGQTDGKYKTDASMKNMDYSVKNKSLAYTRYGNLYIQTAQGEELTVTRDAQEGVVNGQSVHQNEFGISKGTFWSPRGNALAFYRKDESMVTSYPLVDASARTAKLKELKYPMAGMKSHHVTIGVYNLQSNKTVYLKTGTPKEKFLTNVTWSPDEKSIYVAELNREQNVCEVKSYDAATGELITTLFTESHPKYVEPENPPIFFGNDSKKFVWLSKRDGYNHAYLYSSDGKMLKQLTSGNWDIASVIGVDGSNLIYLSTEDSPIEKHIYKVSALGGRRTKLSKEVGTHSAVLSPSTKLLYDAYTSQKNPGKVSLINLASGKVTLIHEAKDPYVGKVMPEITLGTLRANNGTTDLYYRLVKPTNFDPNKKYPVVVYVYGGPHSQMVDNSWMGQARGWDIYMAEKGYVVFTLDNRGTNYRGADFENITHRQLGVIETQDQMTGVNYLQSIPFVDTSRIGVHGWSYGGFMTLNLMLRHPETFKVGVAGGPVTDWKYYEIMYGERYMDSPQENPDGYKESSMVERAGDLKGRLLLIHGDEDPVVLPQHSLQYLKSSVKKGAHPDFFIYTGHEHNMLGPDRVHLHEHITRYFDDFLK